MLPPIRPPDPNVIYYICFYLMGMATAFAIAQILRGQK